LRRSRSSFVSEEQGAHCPLGCQKACGGTVEAKGRPKSPAENAYAVACRSKHILVMNSAASEVMVRHLAVLPL
jgi:hypothetical protein